MKKFLMIAGMLLAAFLGGLCSQFVFSDVYAQHGETVTDQIFVYTPQGAVGGQIYTIPGTGAAVVLNDAAGHQRLQLGTYNQGAEQGLPLIGLTDNNGHLKMLLRLAGENQSPVLIFKDNKGVDRIVMGLGLSDAGEEPFLSYVDKNGTKTNVFGNY
jgi:hypothetical protein